MQRFDIWYADEIEMVFEMQILDGVAVRACMGVCMIRCCAVSILFMFDLRPFGVSYSAGEFSRIH